MFIECNLFMVIAREEKAQELLCAGMLKSERSWSKVLITEMRRDVIEMAKIWTFFLPTSEQDVSHFWCSC